MKARNNPARLFWTSSSSEGKWNFQLPCQSCGVECRSQSCWLGGCYAKHDADRGRNAVLWQWCAHRSNTVGWWLSCYVGDLFVYFVVFLAEAKLPWNGVRIDADSLCTAPFLTEEKKTFHDVQRAFTFRNATPSCRVSARSFLSNLNLCKSFIGCLNLPPFSPSVLMQTLWLHVWLHRVGSFGNQSFVSAKL